MDTSTKDKHLEWIALVTTCLTVYCMDIAVRVVIPGLAPHGAHRVDVTEKTRQHSRRRDSVTLSEAAGVVAGRLAGEDI